MTRTLLAALLTVWATPAWAITCTIVSTSGPSFGSYDVFDTSPVDTTATITYNCTSVLGGDNITIELSAGGAASFSPREMSDGGSNRLEYNLYTSAARTTIFGDGTSGTAIYGPLNPADGTNVDVTVFGRIPALQDLPAASYSDTITVTLTY